MSNRFRDGDGGARKLARKGERAPLVTCLYCANGTNVRRDRIAAHTRKQHPGKRSPSFIVLPPERQPSALPDDAPREARAVKAERHETRRSNKPVAWAVDVRRAIAEQAHGDDRPFFGYAARQAPPPAERPPYWEACEEMDFGELRAFIDAHLHGPSKVRTKAKTRVEASHGVSLTGQSVRTKDGLLGLLGLLSWKVLEEIWDGDRSTLGLRYVTESPRLGALRRRQKKLREALLKAQSGSAKRLGATKGLRGQLMRVNALIAGVEEEERRRRQLQTRRVEIVERIGRDIDRAFDAGGDKLITGRLPWSVFPPGELSVDTLRRHYANLQRRNPHIHYDPERIEKAFSLGPNGCYVGREEFDGYVVFTFAHTDRALLECPVYGNAIYVLGPDWRRFSKLSKQELLSGRPRGVDKIVHRGNWFGKAKLALGIQ